VTQDPDLEFDKVYQALCAIPDVSSILCEGISKAVDEVVDPVRSGRWTVSQLEQPEKTVIGIRVENVLRMDLGLQRAKRLDVVIDGTNVDIKFTIADNWTIPPEAVGELCLLARFNVDTTTVSAGLLRTTDLNLNRGKNRDLKRTVAAAGRDAIRWFIQDQRPERSIVGFLAAIDDKTRALVTDPSVGAQERLNRLFLAFKYKPIPETVVEAIAIGHVDWERRLRPDKRNRKAPETRGFEVLRSTSPGDRKRLAAMQLPPLRKGYCIAVDPQ
jgi:hypothetical protein